jgi:hypothetical protein
MIATLLANIHRDSNHQPFKIEDFMPGEHKEERRQTPEEQKEIFQRLARMQERKLARQRGAS